jgi:asparagine synthase (glutamine-hydrolysing)
MNPFYYWYKVNTSLRKKLNEYFMENIELLDCYKELKKDASSLFEQGNVLEKTQVITLLATIKLYGLK